MPKLFPYPVDPSGGTIRITIVARHASYVGGRLLFTSKSGAEQIEPVLDAPSETAWEIPGALEGSVRGANGETVQLEMFNQALELSLWAGARAGSPGRDVHVDLIVEQDGQPIHPENVKITRIPAAIGNRISTLEEVILVFLPTA